MRIVLALILLAGVTSFAQSPATFEVASIKPGKPGDTRYSFRWSPGGAFSAHLPLQWLTAIAYDVKRIEHVTGGPEWVRTQYFEIEARPGREVSRQESGAMLRQLLADRFRLMVRGQSTELQAHVLEMARPDARLGPGIRRTEGECIKVSSPPMSQRELRAAQPVPCGFASSGGFTAGGGVPVTMLLASLSLALGTDVVDRTGLSGSFDFYIPTPRSGTSPAITPDANEMSVFTIVEEHLGMRLRREQVATGTLMIERVEQPAPN
jgi:uncharacterized protein (TIGR03435 family)